MGIRSFLHRLYAKVKEVITGQPSKYRNFRCKAWFDNGATAEFNGCPVSGTLGVPLFEEQSH